MNNNDNYVQDAAVFYSWYEMYFRCYLDEPNPSYELEMKQHAIISPSRLVRNLFVVGWFPVRISYSEMTDADMDFLSSQSEPQIQQAFRCLLINPGKYPTTTFDKIIVFLDIIQRPKVARDTY
jgi:hypothetical protein